MKNRYSKIFLLLKLINNQPGATLSKEELVKDFTNGQKGSLKDLSDKQLMELENRLQQVAPKPADHYKLDKLRKAIISQFLSVGKTVNDAINWAEKYGVSGKKKPFNDYTGQELYILLQNAIKMKNYTLKSITKTTS